MSGTTDRIKGTIKEVVGKVTGDKRTETEGKTDQVKGDAKNVVQDVTDSARGVGDSLRNEDARR